MKTYFDEETDKKLLEAETEEEVRAIIAATPKASELADKIDLVMKEIASIKSDSGRELDLDELDNVAGGKEDTIRPPEPYRPSVVPDPHITIVTKP
ncbi:MAG: hypothetical protein IJ740_11995 [Ruminococcus sp.]|nr:hypothetical protein [Ruminococcus sp.]